MRVARKRLASFVHGKRREVPLDHVIKRHQGKPVARAKCLRDPLGSSCGRCESPAAHGSRTIDHQRNVEARAPPGTFGFACVRLRRRDFEQEPNMVWAVGWKKVGVEAGVDVEFRPMPLRALRRVR